jgi:hypothetical protein
MGNQRNARKRIPTAKKSAANDLDSPPRPPRINFRAPPKARPTGKAAKDHRSVTWADNIVGRVNHHEAAEDVVNEDDMDESGIFDEYDEEDEEPGM